MVIDKIVNEIEFAELEKEIAKTNVSILDRLAPEIGKIYVVSITREGCPSCNEQEPRIEELAKTMLGKHGSNVVFSRIHVQYSPGNDEESLRSKDLLGHYFYPTNMILLRTGDRGAIQYYRNVEPEMNELEKNIGLALEIATVIGKNAH